MPEIALTKEPFKIAVSCAPDPVGPEGGLLFAVPASVRLVALLAVLPVKQGASVDRLRPGGKWIGARMILGWDVLPPIVRTGRKGDGGAKNQEPTRPGHA